MVKKKNGTIGRERGVRGPKGVRGTSDEKERRVEDDARIAHLDLSPGFRGDAREGAAG